MERLRVEGLKMYQGQQPFTWRGCLDWSLPGLLLEQGTTEYKRILRDRRSVGANTICVAGMLTWGHPFSPDSPGYWDMVRDQQGRSALLDIAAEEGMRICFVTFCDTASLMPDRGAQRAHWQRIYTSWGDKDNVSLVLVNQAGHPSQALSVGDIDQFERPPSIAGFPALLAAKNNPFEDNPVPSPAWDFSTFCGKRNYPNWFIESGGLSMWTVVHDQAAAPAVLFEPIRCGDKFADQGAMAPGHWRQLARSLSFEGTIGGNFYSDDNAQARVLSPGVVHNSAVEFLGNIPQP